MRHQFHPVVCQVEVGRVAAADPPQHLAWRFRPPTELRERLVVLHAAGGRALDAREVLVQTGQHRLADVGAKGGYLWPQIAASLPLGLLTPFVVAHREKLYHLVGLNPTACNPYTTGKDRSLTDKKPHTKRWPR